MHMYNMAEYIYIYTCIYMYTRSHMYMSMYILYVHVCMYNRLHGNAWWTHICRIMIGKLIETSSTTSALGFFLVVSLLPYWHKCWPRMDPWIYLLNYFCSKEATLFVSLCWSELRTLCRTFSWCLTGTLSGLSFLSLLGSSLGAWLALAEPSNI